MNQGTVFRVLGGLSKGLGIAKNVLPIINDTKPIIKNAKTVISNFNNIGNRFNKTTTNNNSTPIKKERIIIDYPKHNPSEIKQSIKTLYTYIEIGVFNEYGIDNFSLKEQVNRKQFNKKYKKRKEPVNYDGHKYEDFLKFKQENPSTPVTEMDTVLNSLSGPYIQTFEFEKTGIMIGYLHKEKTSESMAKTLNKLQHKLGHNIYCELFSLLLTDRGTEFEKSELFEFNMETGELRSNIFYCDPYKSSQKPHIENTHNYIRDIIPNEIDLTNLTQEDLDLMFSHINSTPRKIYNGKTPYEMFIFLHSTEDNPKRGKEILDKLNIKKIKRDEVVLKPYLIKHKLNK